MRWWIKVPLVPVWELDDSEIKIREQWIRDNIGKRSCRSGGYFHFRTKKDAMFFTLRWA